MFTVTSMSVNDVNYVPHFEELTFHLTLNLSRPTELFLLVIVARQDKSPCDNYMRVSLRRTIPTLCSADGTAQRRKRLCCCPSSQTPFSGTTHTRRRIPPDTDSRQTCGEAHAQHSISSRCLASCGKSLQF